MNPLPALNGLGQIVWLDDISRSLFMGGLPRLIDEDGLGGVTSNPTIFEKAIASSADYDAATLRALDADRNLSDRALAERLIVEDIQMALPTIQDATAAKARHLRRVVAWPPTFEALTATQTRTGSCREKPCRQRRPALGPDVRAITEQLQADAVKAFASSFDQLVATLAGQRRQLLEMAS